MSSILRVYNKILKRYPIITQAVQTSLLMGTGDLISQTVIENKPIKHITWKRTAQFACIGLFVAGPILRTWYGILNKHVGQHGSSVTLKKVALDQFLFAPIFIVILLLSINGLQGQSLEKNTENLKRCYPDILVNNYKVWPWVQLVNFYFIPLNYQVLLVQIVALFWNSYISWKTNKKID